MRNAGGEAASLREAPLPQTPSPEERLGIGLRFPSGLCAHDTRARFLVLGLWSRRLTEPPRPCGAWGQAPPPACGGHLPFQGRLFSTCSPKGMPRAKRVPHPLRLPAPKHRPSLKTERFQRGRSCGTVGNPVRGAPARLHRHKLFVRGGSGGRRAAWKPRRPPAAFGSFPLRERNSCVRRRTKLPQATPCPRLCAANPKAIPHNSLAA